jgi:uncharacterized protein
MSQENVEIVQRGYDHFNRTGEPDFSLLDPDVLLDTSNAAFVRGQFRGHDGFREWLATQRDMWKSQRMEPEELIPIGDDRVIVCLRVVGVGRDGIETVAHFANVTTLRSGRVTYVKVFLTKAEALEAVGLSE